MVATQGAVPLGVVKWWGAWRKYAFFPNPDTLYEQDCLRDIAQIIVDLTNEHNAKVGA